jgi:threonine/homoserine/homoserine lactone efflux protein
MDWALWAGFVVASLIVGLLPGPGVTSIVGYALTSGLRTALGSVFGATAGNAVAMAFSLAGVGVLLEQYPAAFSILKWVGAVYLIGIGLFGMMTANSGDGGEIQQVRSIDTRTAFWGTFAITAINPKTIIFFVAFTPQFMSSHLDYWTQAGVLFVTFVTVVTVSDGFYAVAASWVASFLKGPKVQVWSKRIGGAVLMAAGVATATVSV